MSEPLNPSHTVEAVDHVILSRRSIRAFLPTPVPRDTVEAILRAAARAPSGTNIQPWQVHVLTGAARDDLVKRVTAASRDPERAGKYRAEYAYYPNEWTSPFIERRRKVGWDLYGLLGITRDNKEGMSAQHERNYCFFDAPVGLMFSIKRHLAQGSWLDYGMFLQNIMIAARARGLDTCPQAAFIDFHRVIADALNYSAEDMFVCGMSLGYADPDKAENGLVTERAELSEFVTWLE